MLFVSFVSLILVLNTKKSEVSVEKCGSCISVLDAIKTHSAEEISKNDLSGFMKRAMEVCKKFSDGSPMENVCYTIGARSDSASSSLNDIFKSIGYLPADKHCMDLEKKLGGVCKDKVKLVPDWNDLSKYTVKQLKAFLKQESDSCQGCLEKSDYVQRLLTHKPKADL